MTWLNTPIDVVFSHECTAASVNQKSPLPSTTFSHILKMMVPLSINLKDFYDETIPSGITQPCFNYLLVDGISTPVTTFSEAYLTFD
jgi:hypothetical protein